MDMLQGLADFFGSKSHEYGLAKDVLTDTFHKVRKLLQHEVHFIGEQKTLVEAFALYRFVPKVRVPQPPKGRWLTTMCISVLLTETPPAMVSRSTSSRSLLSSPK